jgi:guanylate kinase
MASLDIRPLLFVISGPSGAGKSTAVDALVEARLVLRLVTYTTRPMRTSEQNGVDYNFVSDEAFLDLCANEEIVEYRRRYGHYYGAPRAVLSDHDKRPALINLDPIGFLRIKASPSRRVVGIYVTPSSQASVAERIRCRINDTHGDYQRRAADFVELMPFAVAYDYVLLNDQRQDFLEAVKVVVRCENNVSRSAQWVKASVAAASANTSSPATKLRLHNESACH